jgi:transcriptional regulator with XRE-family HTH domain
LTGRALADAAGWHFTRVSKLENGVQSPTDQDIRTWCAVCSADAQVADIIAQARAVESMYLEFKRQARAGMKQMMLSALPLYQRTEQFRIYEHHTLPGLFQTAPYTRAMLQFWFSFLDVRNDIEETVAAKMARQSVLYERGKTFSVVLEEAALYTQYGDADTLAGQLDRLLSLMGLANISVGIVPMTVEREVVAQVRFWIFDDLMVSVETPTASIEITTPQEITLYGRMFDHLRRPALYGRDARSLVMRVLGKLT